MHKAKTNMVESTEFYQGWLVELLHSEAGYQFSCYSPTRLKMVSDSCYASHLNALQGAMQYIDQVLTCQGLRKVLREMMEAQKLSLEEFQGLAKFLEQVCLEQPIRLLS